MRAGGSCLLFVALLNFVVAYARKTIPSEEPYCLKLILTNVLNAFLTFGGRQHALRLFLLQMAFHGPA